MNQTLQRTVEIEKNAKEFGFYWPDYLRIIKNIISETEEIDEAIKKRLSKEYLQEEIGDLIFASLSLCIFLDFDPEETIEKANDKIGKRIAATIENAKKAGYKSLKGESIHTKLKFWDQAKIEEKLP